MPQKRNVPRMCQQCGGQFLAFAWCVKKGEGRFCSLPCSNQWKADKQRKTAEEYIAWFWDQTKRSANGCLEWMGQKDKKGYGKYTHEGFTKLAHREAWRFTYGFIDQSLVCCHTCDNPPCVDVTHLFLGTSLDNTLDKIAKGRQPSKLTADQVLYIRDAYSDGNVSMKRLGALFDIDASHIHAIIHRRIWKHI